MIPYSILAALREVANRAGFDGAFDRTFRECSPGERVMHCQCQRVIELKAPIAFGFIGGCDVQQWRIGQCSCGRIGCAGPMPPKDMAAMTAEQAAVVGDGQKKEWRG